MLTSQDFDRLSTQSYGGLPETSRFEAAVNKLTLRAVFENSWQMGTDLVNGCALWPTPGVVDAESYRAGLVVAYASILMLHTSYLGV